MKKLFNSFVTGMFASLLLFAYGDLSGQSANAVIKKYMKELPSVPVSRSMQKYRMTAIYTNRDLYGNFTGKIKVSGEYTKKLDGDSCRWNNVLISSSSKYSDPFPEGALQNYIEGFTYVPSPEMLSPVASRNFPPNPESVYARNLIWDMLAIENFTMDFNDSLSLNKIYRIPDSDKKFNMADIGTYSHAEIQLCWTGISEVEGELCAIIEFRAIDNKIEMSMDALKTKGTEQYWGTIWVALSNRMVEHAEMYGGTMQEIAITGVENKFLVKTIRELWVDKIQ